MKVYFDATPTQIEKYRGNYAAISKAIEDLGHELTSRWMVDFNESFFELPRDKWKDHYRKIVNSVYLADVTVVEISVSSTSVGQLIQQSLIWKKPVIAMRSNGGKPNIFLEGAGDVESKLLVVEYDLRNVLEKLEEALKYVEDWLETRFTLILDGETRKLLDKQSDKKGYSRSDLIRDLIRKEAKGEGK